MKYRLILLALIFSQGSKLLAQDTGSENLSLSLEQAVEYAMEHNVLVRNAELEIEAAKKEVWKTTSIGLPHANAQLDYQHLPGDLPTLDFPNPEGGVQQIKLGVKNSSTYSVTVSQLIFSGEYFVGLQAAKTYKALSQNSFEKQKIDTRSTVSSAYYTILLLESTRDFLDSSLVNNRKIAEQTKATAEAGFIDETDYEQLSIIINNLENGLKSAERQLNLAYRLFKISLGLPEESEVKLSQNIDDLLKNVEFTALMGQDFDLAKNIDYRILLTSEKVSELNLKRELSLFLPTISGFYLYQDKTNKPDFDITFNHILGVSVALPIFSSGQRLASVSQAKIDLQKTSNLKTQTGDNLLMAIAQARGDFQTAYDKFETEKKNSELAKKIYNRTLIKFQQGMVSSLELTQAYDQYLNSVNSYTNAILDVLNTKTALEEILSNQ